MFAHLINQSIPCHNEEDITDLLGLRESLREDAGSLSEFSQNDIISLLNSPTGVIYLLRFIKQEHLQNTQDLIVTESDILFWLETEELSHKGRLINNELCVPNFLVNQVKIIIN